MTSDEAMEVLGYLLGHEKAVDSGEMEDVQNCLNSQEQEALKVVLYEFLELKEKATAKKPIPVDSGVYDYDFDFVCPNCGENVDDIYNYCDCGQHLDWSEEKE